MNLFDYLGKFHPLLVHLPIGILSLFLLMAIFISRKELIKSFRIIRLTLLISALAATFSSLSGYILMTTGSYSGDLITGHQVLGIALTIINWIVFIQLNFLLSSHINIYRIALGILLILMIFTGHAGGSLTHGGDFLTPPAPSTWFVNQNQSNRIIDLNSSVDEVAFIILEEKCVVCHGPNKQQGELRLDSKSGLLAGGKSGEAIGDEAHASLMIQRIYLPMEEEEHMPPAERKQLTKLEIDFLTWWIDEGTPFNQSLADLSFPDSLSGILTIEEVPDPFIPEEEIVMADPSTIENLTNFGIVIQPIAADSHYLSANFVNVLEGDLSDAITELLEVKNHIIYLSLDDHQLGDELWDKVGQLYQLRKLSVRNTNLGDGNIASFSGLENMVSMNLVGTDVTAAGIQKLGGLTDLRYLFLYRSGFEASDFSLIQEFFPKASIDTGNYQVPTLASDTTVYRMKK
jgi:uncharacterized membrane protein